jgi:hypothetical protein
VLVNLRPLELKLTRTVAEKASGFGSRFSHLASAASYST